ncbi:unnamed protein product [Allacma fusca]|uniref:Proline dehydrogenase n=1 Tax=Allacma fusca TaxID=39272 RepID=A0A8J2PFJ5_9HEXA|nr:unnamed protein product [Allacma fusca]
MAVFRIVRQRRLLLNWIESRISSAVIPRKYMSRVIPVDLFNSRPSHFINVPVRAKTTATSTTLLDSSTTSTCDQDGVEHDSLDLTFNDAKAAFRSKTTAEIIRAYTVFQLCNVPYLVNNNQKLMQIGRKVLGKNLFHKLMKMSFYGHFVAGENQVAIQPQIQRLRSFGVKAILDYSVEEDITEEQAVTAEMEIVRSCNPVAGTDTANDDRGYAQYKADKGFADRRTGVEAARTYFYRNEAQCEKNMEIFIQSIEAVSGATKGTGFAAIKVTALGRPQLLLHLSEAIARVHKYVAAVTGKEGYVQEQHIKPDILAKRLEKLGAKDVTVQSWLKSTTYDNLGLIHILPWQGVVGAHKKLREAMKVPNLSTGQMQNLLPPLTDVEEEMFNNMMRRLHSIFKVATKLDVRVMVDAEQTYLQPAISRLAMEMARIYNTEKAIVFNTYQCYLKNALHYLTLDLVQSERQNFYFGCKLVRGAYMNQERARAKELNYEDPICSDYDATSSNYENCLTECLRRIQQKKGTDRSNQFSIMVATHSEDTIRFAIHKMKEFGIQPADRVICFGQLYGMCDQVSFPLGQSGFSVYKYVPYGPVDGVLPYLSRRAQENSDDDFFKDRSLTYRKENTSLCNFMLLKWLLTNFLVNNYDVNNVNVMIVKWEHANLFV